MQSQPLDADGPIEREQYLKLALDYVPHLTQLCDRNRLSPTFGCFDREYWHYRTSDFPCGMSQECLLSFAMLHAGDYPGNPYFGWERLREIAVAGIDFSMRSAHANGSCDDYFPYEQAMGALVFSTYAGTEAYRILSLSDDRFLDFFARRGDYLAQQNEAGRLSNHQALAALAAYNIFLVTGEERFRKVAEDRVEMVLSWQHPEEGWFQEYEGADPGYQTCTISFLSKLWKKSEGTALAGQLVDPIIRAVEFAEHFMHPDGSYGGEYGSRNSYHFYPHGFEIAAHFTPVATRIADGFLKSVRGGKRYFNDDDRMCGHLVHEWLHAYEDFLPQRSTQMAGSEAIDRWFPDAGMVVIRNENYHAVANLKKGGVIKVYGQDHCLASDTGPIAELDDGTLIVTHLMDDRHDVSADPGSGAFEVRGLFAKRHHKLATPPKQIMFRVLNITLGRFLPDLFRRLLQKILIVGKTRSAFRFQRRIEFGADRVAIIDQFPDPMPVKRLEFATDATSIYVAASNVFQDSVLRLPWRKTDTAEIQQIRQGGARFVHEILMPAPVNKP